MKGMTGFSLIELLVSMVVGILIMLGVSEVFLSTKKANLLLMAESELQENARFAFSSITRIVQQASHFGCRTSSDLSTSSLLDFNDQTFKPWVGIEGWESGNTAYGQRYVAAVSPVTFNTPNSHWTASGNAVLDAGIQAVSNADMIKVWYTSPESTHLDSASAGSLTFSPIDLEQGDIVVVNDCNSVVFAQVCACESSDKVPCFDTDTQADISQAACNNPGNKVFNPSSLNLATAEMRVLREAVFFIGIREGSSDGVPSLFMHRLGYDGKLGVREEIMEGVESLQVLYGEDTNNDKSPDYYTNADSVVNWNNVVSIRLSLLMRSTQNNLLADASSVDFHGAKITVKEGDRYLRRAYTSTISLRNRNIGY